MNRIEVIIEKDYAAASRRAADIFADQLRTKPDGVYGFATGSSPVGMYKELIRLHKEQGLDFSGIKTFNLDEYYPMTKDNDQSYFYFMRDNLFNHVNINLANTNIPNGEAADAQAECEAYEQRITDEGGIDLQILGIGLNGHIGFNEPNDHFTAATNLVKLTQSTVDANARFFASADEVPKHALTMGIGTIMASRRILLIVSSAAKAQILRDMLRGPVTPQVPASILQFHGNVTIVADEAAASLL